MFFLFDFILDQYKTQEMYDRVVSENVFLIVFCSDKYNAKWICDEAVDDSLGSLKLIPNWFIASKMINPNLVRVSLPPVGFPLITQKR